MNELQEWCKEILPVVQAAANGEVIEYLDGNGEWQDKFLADLTAAFEYRIKPRTIKIGDIEVPEPMREVPEIGADVWYIAVHQREVAVSTEWNGSGWQHTMLERGLVHKSQLNAEAHAEAIIAQTAK